MHNLVDLAGKIEAQWPKGTERPGHGEVELLEKMIQGWKETITTQVLPRRVEHGTETLWWTDARMPVQSARD